MSKLVVLVGPPGSGKTTLATELCNSDITAVRYINQDSQGKEHLPLFLDSLEMQCDIVVDRMGFNKTQRARYLEPAKKAGYETHIIVLHENRETCLKRMLNRYNHPTIQHGDSKTANSALDTFFTQYERPTQDEATTVEFRYPKPNLRLKAIVVDVDNTLSDANHREHLLEKTDTKKPNWPAFFNAMGEDPLNSWCKDLMKRYREDHIIILNSGRPDSYRNITEEWLKKYNVPYDHLFMRHRSDSRKDDIVKELLYDFEVLTRVDSVTFWVDDRLSVINKIRSRGVLVLDCKGNTF
jgi:predicted kinase